MITEDYVSFEIAKLLKEKGFNEPCHATYDTAVTGGKPKFSEYEVLSYFPYGMKNTDDMYNMVISAPTLQMAMKWLREVHKLDIDVSIEYIPKIENILKKVYYYSILKKTAIRDIDCLHSETNFKSYEEACETAIKYCLENLI